MSTIGNMAITQVKMAQVSAKYGVSSSNLFAGSSVKKTSSSDAMESILKNKSEYFQSQYKKLYNSIFPSEEDTENAEKTVSVKSAAAAAANSSGAISSYADSLDYGGTVNVEEAEKKLQTFVDDYNSMVEALGDSDNQSVLQKGVVLVNTTKVYSNALNRVGITVGSDNKLSFDKEKLSGVKNYEFKSTFGRGGYASKVTQKAQQIQRLQGSTGNLFSYSNSITPSYTYNIGTLFSTYA